MKQSDPAVIVPGSHTRSSRRSIRKCWMEVEQPIRVRLVVSEATQQVHVRGSERVRQTRPGGMLHEGVMISPTILESSDDESNQRVVLTSHRVVASPAGELESL